jgi:trimethylamine:corrinoid methyltransferase-like protein
MWMPYVTDHVGYDSWAAAGAKDYAARAREHARQLIESHQPQSIDDSTNVTLRRLSDIT